MYFCQSCIDKHRLEVQFDAPTTSNGVCEICWHPGNLVWVRALLPPTGRGTGPDREWLRRCQERGEGVSMEQITAAFLNQ